MNIHINSTAYFSNLFPIIIVVNVNNRNTILNICSFTIKIIETVRNLHYVKLNFKLCMRDTFDKVYKLVFLIVHEFRLLEYE